MRPILLILTLIIISCGKYQYLTVSSHQSIKNDQKELVIENDTLKVVYSFSSGLMVVSIYNKSSEPLEVNWKKSAFIREDNPVPYYSPDLLLSGDVKVDSAKRFWTSNTSYKGDINAKLLASDASQFLPPRSVIVKKIDVLPYRKFKNLPSEKMRNQTMKSGTDISFVYRELLYTEELSPLRFRNFLTLVSSSGTEFYLDHYFYISEIWISKQTPSYMPQKIQMSRDRIWL